MRLLIAGLLLASLTACGGGGSGGGGDAEAQCADLFTVGKTLPKDFDGCYKGSEPEAVMEYECKDGAGDLVQTDEAMARKGGPVQERTEDAYAAEFDKCNGL